MQQIRQIFKSFIVRDLRPLEDKDGIRIGEDIRIHREMDKDNKKKYVLRFLKDTPEHRKLPIRERLDENNVNYEEGKPYTL